MRSGKLFVLALLAGTVLLAAAIGGPAQEPAEGLKLVAQLVWGTNQKPPTDKELKPIAPEIEKRLRRVFKWQNYWEVDRKSFAVTAAEPARVDMSKECRIEVARPSANEIEIQLFGKGKLVVKKRQRILPDETVILAGDDKDDNAWLLVLRVAR